jgi:predicted SAM-dependent methyltransferase
MKALNIGCHDIHIAGMINIDIDPAMKPDLLLDCTKLTEHFEAESIDFIYAGHLLEHLTMSEGKKLVSDIYRILKQYGTFVTTIPDYTKCANMSIEETESVVIAGGQHKVLMNIQRLKKYMHEAGFCTIAEVQPNEIPHCPFPKVTWQTSAIAIKHPIVYFHGIN